MDQLNRLTEKKGTLTLIDEDLGENSFIHLVDTLLLTVLDITSGKGKISKTFINAELIEFKLQRPNCNTNIIIQYDLKPVNESATFLKTSDVLLNSKEEASVYKYNEEFTNEKTECLEKEIELQFTQFANHIAVSNGNYLRDKMFISSVDNITNCKQTLNYSFSDLNNNMFADHMHTLFAENKTFSYVEKLAPQKSSFDKCLLVEENKLKKIQSCEKRYSCSVCGKTFMRHSSISRHKKLHTDQKTYTCSICGKNFSQLWHKNCHEKIHAKEKVHSCSICGRTFKSASNKVQHEQSHIENKPFACNVCGKTFANSDHRSRHERLHSEEKNFDCRVCGKLFMKQSDRRRHEMIHTGEKPYSCTFCGRCFSQSATKIAHERLHTGEKPYSCSVCGKSFVTSSRRLFHRKYRCQVLTVCMQKT